METIYIGIITSIIAAVIYDTLKSKYLPTIISHFIKLLRKSGVRLKNNFKHTNFKERTLLKDIIKINKDSVKNNLTNNDTLKLMVVKNRRCLPVENKYGEYLGLIFKDQISAAINHGRGNLLISTEMLPKNSTLYFHVSDECGNALNKLNEKIINSAPVLLNKKVQGFISKKLIKNYLN